MTLKELFSSRERWTQGAYARNHEGGEVDWEDPSAVCWCLMGGLNICYPPGLDGNYTDESRKAFSRIHSYFAAQDMYVDSFVAWQDSHERTFEDILELVEGANI